MRRVTDRDAVIGVGDAVHAQAEGPEPHLVSLRERPGPHHARVVHEGAVRALQVREQEPLRRRDDPQVSPRDVFVRKH